MAEQTRFLLVDILDMARHIDKSRKDDSNMPSGSTLLCGRAQ